MTAGGQGEERLGERAEEGGKGWEREMEGAKPERVEGMEGVFCTQSSARRHLILSVPRAIQGGPLVK